MECYVCGFILPEGANFCPNCGRNRVSVPEDQEHPVPSAEPEKETEVPVFDFAEESSPEEMPEASAETSAPPAPDPLPDKEAEDAHPLSVPESTETETTPVSLPPAEEEPPKPARPAASSGRRSVTLPIVIMTVLMLIGLLCFWAIPYHTDEVPSDAGVQEPEKPPLPNDKQDQDKPSGSRSDDFVPTDDRCFVLEDGEIRFLPEKYDGGAVLVIPNEIDGEPVTAIADNGFAELEGITTVILPDGLEIIGEHAFADCAELRGVYFPESVRTIGGSAFRDCIELESVWISETMQHIGEDAFVGCASLMYIFYGGTYEAWVELYNEYVTPFTTAICSDGDYYHGVQFP